MKAPLTLITIIIEGLLKEKTIALLKGNGATGFTITRTEGEGSRGVRAKDFEGPNLKFECIIAKENAEAILEAVGDAFFENYSVIAWLTEVEVARSTKFAEEEA
jgi:nitrogen regulatory protein PII